VDDRVGVGNEPDLLLSYTNKTSTPLDLPGSLSGMRLLVDAQPFAYRLDKYDGFAYVGPGESAAFLLSLDRFQGALGALTPGHHLIRLEFGGAQSPPVEVRVDQAHR
jgi:hypothetical protein